MYKNNTFMCLSFQQKKRISTLSGRGGAILTDDINAYRWFKRVSSDGRDMSQGMLHENGDDITFGYNCYMPPKDAMSLIHEMNMINTIPLKFGSWEDYRDLLSFKYIREKAVK
jgi:dTDP-4-amino-4,6-dideoxygalactose transaminase